MSRDDGLAQYPPLTAVDLDHRHVWGERWRDRQVPHRLGGSCHYRPPFPERSQVPPRTPGAAPVVGRRNVQKRTAPQQKHGPKRGSRFRFSSTEVAQGVGHGQDRLRDGRSRRRSPDQAGYWLAERSNAHHAVGVPRLVESTSSPSISGSPSDTSGGSSPRTHPVLQVGSSAAFPSGRRRRVAVTPGRFSAIASSTGSRSRGEAAGIGVASGRRAEPSSA